MRPSSLPLKNCFQLSKQTRPPLPSKSMTSPVRILQRLRNSTLPLTLTRPSEIAAFTIPPVSQRPWSFRRLLSSINSVFIKVYSAPSYPFMYRSYSALPTKKSPHAIPISGRVDFRSIAGKGMDFAAISATLKWAMKIVP